MADIMDYWNGAGYGQIPEEQSLYGKTGGYQSPAPWANANTYAPTTNPTWSPDLGQGSGLWSHNTGTQIGTGLGVFYNPATWMGFGWGSPKKKAQAPNVNWPSYQGTGFTPAEGLPKYYNPSQETNNQTQQQLYMGQQAQQGQQQDSLMSSLQNALSAQGQGGGYDYNYGGGQPQYVGQQEQAYGSFYGGQNKGINQTFNPSNPYGM